MGTIIFCDRCKKPLEDFKYVFPFFIEEVPHYLINRGIRGKVILCHKCNKALDKWFKEVR
jgi:hypothetical protein